MNIRNLILPLAICAGCGIASAGQLMLTARLDSSTMLMGTRNTLNLEVVQDRGVKGRFPLFERFGPEGILTLLNDTIELDNDMKVDTTEVGSGRIQINCRVPLQAFDSGCYKLPKFVFVAGNDSVSSEELLLTVVPVSGVTADTPISPMTDVASPEDASIFDHLPDWLYYYWWIYLLVIAAGVAGFFLWKRYRSVGTILPRKPEEPPYDRAMRELRNLGECKLWENGREKEYYTRLTDILRRYLAARFGIQAMEMTSSEIMSHLADVSRDEKIPRDKMRDILDMADFVKFAMVRPLPDDNKALYQNAIDFVESTRPVTTASDGKSEGKSDAGAAGVETTSAEAPENQAAPGRRGRNARNSDPDKMKSSGRGIKVGRIGRRRAGSDEAGMGKEVKR